MEFANFAKVLWRHKWTLILLPLITAGITFVLIRNLPSTYRSSARIATGLIERPDEFLNRNTGDDNRISQEFSNLIQMMLLKKIVDQVSYQLMINDLSPGNDLYRKQSTVVNELTELQKKQAVDLLKDKYRKMEELSLWDKDQSLINKMLVSKKFDYQSLTKKLNIYRLQSSDYIYLDFESENPMLSAVVLNTLCSEFINYYSSGVNLKSSKTVSYLDSLLKEKQTSVSVKMNDLKDFKIKNGILDVTNQATVLMGQIADYQAKKQESEKNIIAYSSILANINSKLSLTTTKGKEKNLTQSIQDIAATRHWLDVLNEQYQKTNDARYKVSIDSLQTVLSAYILEATSNNNRTESKENQDLVKEKLNTEINLDMARNSLTSLDTMIKSLSRKLDELTPSEANIQVYEKDIENERKEYEDLMNKFNQTKLESNFSVRLRQVEMAMPEVALPSRKILLLLFSAVAAFLLVTGILFVMYYLDQSITDPRDLAENTGQPVLGSLNLISAKGLKPSDIWGKKNDVENIRMFKSQLRAIRFEIDNQLPSNKMISLTSLKSGEGNTFFAINLAMAYKMAKKKVALIDGNFDNPEVTRMLHPTVFLEDFLASGAESKWELEGDSELTVIGNRGDDMSLMETGNSSQILARLAELRSVFDIVIVDIPSLDVFNKAKEWLTFTDKIVCVYRAGTSLSDKNDTELDFIKGNQEKVIGWVMNKVSVVKQKKGKARAGKITYA